MIQKTIKTLYKLKNVTFDTEGRLIDEDGEIYDLKEDLQEIFGTESFTLMASSQDSESFYDCQEMNRKEH
ncbi:hypothetical protein [Ileibacterium valens]|uniref:hypothetical protein n=1 Tax=Ileibacterium valens TaxID=1862668 RepID=UPI00273025D1|nr:hypothetical protein [Ileibacterium valens]